MSSTTIREDAHDPALEAHGDIQVHGTRRSYLIGFVLSVILTAIPFWLVMDEVIESKQGTALLIFAFAIVQIVVHVIYFLHVDTRAEGGWTLISFVFTVVIVAIMIGGSVWVMYHLNTNLMPMTVEDPSQVP